MSKSPRNHADEAVALVRLSLREQEAMPLEVVEAYVADALRQAGFVVRRVNIEWLEEPTS